MKLQGFDLRDSKTKRLCTGSAEVVRGLKVRLQVNLQGWKHRHPCYLLTDDAPGIAVLFRPSYCRLTTRRNRLPKSVVPNIAFPDADILVAAILMNVLWDVSSILKLITSADIRCAYEYGHARRHLSRCAHLQSRRFGAVNPDTELLFRLPERDNGILSPRPNARSIVKRYATNACFLSSSAIFA